MTLDPKAILPITRERLEELERRDKNLFKALKLLAEIEWARVCGPNGETWDGCFFCDSSSGWDNMGPHDTGCPLAKLLGRPTEESE